MQRPAFPRNHGELDLRETLRDDGSGAAIRAALHSALALDPEK